MSDREVLRLIDNRDIWIHTLIYNWDQKHLSWHNRIIKHMIQLADLPLTSLKLKGYLRERFTVLDLVFLDSAKHVRALRHTHSTIGQM